MNKKEVLTTLKKYNLDNNKIIILSTASLVLKEIKDTCNDIDIAVSEDYYEYLKEKYNPKIKAKNVYTIDNIIDFGTNYYNVKTEKINGYSVQSPSEVLKLKQTLNRDKDQKDIALITNYLNTLNINVLALAYLGDAVYEVYIRKYLIEKGINKVNNLQNKAIKYVSAKGQSTILESLINNNVLTKEEITIVKRARNHKSHASPKNTDVITYKKATGLEALIGWLYILGKNDRIKKLMQLIINIEGD